MNKKVNISSLKDLIDKRDAHGPDYQVEQAIPLITECGGDCVCCVGGDIRPKPEDDKHGFNSDKASVAKSDC